MVAAVLVWQVALSALWLVLISTVDLLEVFGGLANALAARRAVSGR
ncbi:hypothetical protein ACFRIC_40045 [Streptomyces sp. NPDC056738]